MSDPSEELRPAKRELRRRVRALRDGLSEGERSRLGAGIAERVLEVPAFARARTVLTFHSFGSEVPTAPIIDRLLAEDRRVMLPKVVGETMEARSYRHGEPMSRASFGALEPAGGELVGPEEIDAVVVPGLAFDRRGFRVGYGGGHFDRFLSRLRADAATVGICFGMQLVEEVPTESHDRPVDWIVTESETIRARGA